MTLYDIFIFIFIVILFAGVAVAAGFIPRGLITGGAAVRNRKRVNTRNRSDHHKDLSKHPRSKSEAVAIMHLEQLTGKKFPTVVPAWLGLELDGYNAELGIALEFSGPLHTKWTPTYESYAKYYERVMRDQKKITVCAENNVRLIVLDMSLPSRHWRNYIASRLYDYGVLPRPIEYIAEQTAVPFRNPQLERELGLVG